MTGQNEFSVICGQIREGFSAYLDGAVSGAEMAVIAAHLDDCLDCEAEFHAWRDVQSALAQIGPAVAPARLQARLRAAIADESAKGTHLPWNRRLAAMWDKTLAPLAFRASCALAIGLLLIGGMGYMFAAPIAVQANDDGLADLRAPRYLYSQVAPQPLNMPADVPVVIEAKVDETGRVYDYAVLEGKLEPSVERQLGQNLLASVFRPASVFGAPVKGHVVLTFTGVSVHI
jgi:anti-sigma factor RsiW